MLKLGFVTAILPDLPLREVASFASASGYSCVEVMCWPKGKAERRYAGVTHIGVAALAAAEAARINDAMKTAGVAISGLGYYPNPLVPDSAEAQVYIDHLKQVILGARLLGPVRMHQLGLGSPGLLTRRRGPCQPGHVRLPARPVAAGRRHGSFRRRRRPGGLCAERAGMLAWVV